MTRITHTRWRSGASHVRRRKFLEPRVKVGALKVDAASLDQAALRDSPFGEKIRINAGEQL